MTRGPVGVNLSAMPKIILFGETGRATVRSRAVIDAPAAGDWTPDNLNADEISGSVAADDVILRADDWEDVRIIAQFIGTPTGSETVSIQAIRSVWKATAPGRDWIPIGDEFPLAPNLASELVLVDGGDMAFRITALTLDGATSVAFVATGGQRLRDR